MRFYAPGTRIGGRYEVAGRPLMDGMGIVYVCRDVEEDHPVALKTFRPEYLPDRAARDRFLREGTAWVDLGAHPHIVRCYNVLYIDPEVYLILELIANQRRDFQHKLSTRLVREYGFIAVEALNVKGLCRSHVSKSMGDAAWRQFLHMVEYRAAKAGTLLMPVDSNGTTQDCSGCGRPVPKTLSQRQHSCPHCGFTAPRDVNAALNILDRGRGRTGPPRRGFLVPARAQVAGCFPL